MLDWLDSLVLLALLDSLDQDELETLELVDWLLLEVEMLDWLDSLLELVDWLDKLDKLDWLELEKLDGLLELAELLELDDWLELDELLELEPDDWLDTLDWLELLWLLDVLELLELRSSIERMLKRSPERGPGNWVSPVWKLRMSGSDSSPVVFVSTSFACQMREPGRDTLTSVAAAPASASCWAAGAESSPATMWRVIVSWREASPFAGPK